MQQKTRTVSVIIPVYNRVKKLARALGSVLNQQGDYVEEIIIIDDGTKEQCGHENTQNLALKYANQYPKVKYFYQKNQGVSAARNLGIEKSKCDYIALLDSDDEWLPEKIQTQMQFLLKTGHSAIHCNETWIENGVYRNQKKRHLKQGGDIFKNCLPLCVISPSAVVIHRSVFSKIGWFDTSLPVCEDYDLWLRLTSNYTLSYEEQALLIKHGGHDGQLSKAYWGMDRFRIQSLEKNFAHLTHLSVDDKSAMLSELLKKITIYSHGLSKRKKFDELEIYQQKSEYYGNILLKLFDKNQTY